MPPVDAVCFVDVTWLFRSSRVYFSSFQLLHHLSVRWCMYLRGPSEPVIPCGWVSLGCGAGTQALLVACAVGTPLPPVPC